MYYSRKCTESPACGVEWLAFGGLWSTMPVVSSAVIDLLFFVPLKTRLTVGGLAVKMTWLPTCLSILWNYTLEVCFTPDVLGCWTFTPTYHFEMHTTCHPVSSASVGVIMGPYHVHNMGVSHSQYFGDVDKTFTQSIHRPLPPPPPLHKLTHAGAFITDTCIKSKFDHAFSGKNIWVGAFTMW